MSFSRSALLIYRFLRFAFNLCLCSSLGNDNLHNTCVLDQNYSFINKSFKNCYVISNGWMKISHHYLTPAAPPYWRLHLPRESNFRLTFFTVKGWLFMSVRMRQKTPSLRSLGCWVMTTSDPEGWIFPSHPHTHDRFCFVLTIKWRV